MSTPTASSVSHAPDSDALRAAVRRRFDARTAAAPALFRTDAAGLFDRFLGALPEGLSAYHRCAACRRFFDRYGGLVLIDEEGRTTPALWDAAEAPAPYAEAVRALAAEVGRAPVTGVFLSREETWGTPQTGPWSHLHVVPRAELLCRSALRTPGQLMAERQQDLEMLQRGLAEFPIDVVREAHKLLRAGSLYRSEKCVEIARWLLGLHERRQAARGQQARDHVTWLAVATAPAGYCHVPASMIGTLLEDIQAGLPFEDIKARFDAKMHPLQYQRPTAAPSAGNIAQAERIIAKLGAEGALARRFARLSDIEALWRPAAPPAPEKKGLFDHLKPKPARRQVEVPPVTMTWDKFSRTVLPTARRIEYLVPSRDHSYQALVTAEREDATPIVQWDSAERRNPVTWYLYVNGSSPGRWGLRPGEHREVTAVALAPHRWHGASGPTHHSEHVLFILQGARDTQYEKGAIFFPEFLKAEYREIRATLEAHAKSAVLSGKDEADACGVSLQKGVSWADYTFRVTDADGAQVSYTLDRWD